MLLKLTSLKVLRAVSRCLEPSVANKLWNVSRIVTLSGGQTPSLLAVSLFDIPRANVAQYQSEAQMAKPILREFMKIKHPSNKDIIQTFAALDGYKLGVSMQDPSFLMLVDRLVLSVKAESSPEQLNIFGFIAHQFSLKHGKFWQKLSNLVLSKDIYEDPSNLLSLYSILIRNRTQSNFGVEFKAYAPNTKQLLLNMRSNLTLLDKLHAAFVYSQLQDPLEEFERDLMLAFKADFDQFSEKFSANDLALTAMVIYHSQVEIEEATKGELLAALAKQFIMRDSVEYDVLLQSYELLEGHPGDVGVRDRLLWESIAFIAIVYADREFYDSTIIYRIDDMVVRKSESDIINFESAALYLSASTLFSVEKDGGLYMRVVQMVQWQLINEGTALYSSFDGKNVAMLLSALKTLSKQIHLDHKSLTEVFDYFYKIIDSQLIDKKIEPEDYYELYSIYHKMTYPYAAPAAFVDMLLTKSKSGSRVKATEDTERLANPKNSHEQSEWAQPDDSRVFKNWSRGREELNYDQFKNQAEGQKFGDMSLNQGKDDDLWKEFQARKARNKK